MEHRKDIQRHGGQEVETTRTDLDASKTDCPFCGKGVESRIVKEYGTVIAVRDKYPVTAYHTLVLPRRHTLDFFTMTPEERRDAETPSCP